MEGGELFRVKGPSTLFLLSFKHLNVTNIFSRKLVVLLSAFQTVRHIPIRSHALEQITILLKFLELHQQDCTNGEKKLLSPCTFFPNIMCSELWNEGSIYEMKTKHCELNILI